jgi:hypothetical protein
MHAPKIVKPPTTLAPQPPGRAGQVQSRPVVGHVVDPLEQAADRAADQAVGSPTATLSPLGGTSSSPGSGAAIATPLRLQRQWSDAPQGPLGGATSTQTTSPSFGWNRGETSVGRIRRIPIETLRLGNQSPDAHPAAEEAANGRAVVLIPDTIDPSRPVEVLLHLHGHNVGYRQRRTAGAHASLRAGSVRDIDTDRIEQQIEASGRPMIGVLPQGTTGSDFGGFDSNAYIADVFRVLSGIGAFGRNPAPRIGRVVLSGHSGAGRPIADMLSQPGQPRLPSSLGEVALFDSINGDAQLAAVRDWVLLRLGQDLATLTGSGITPTQQQAQLQAGLRFRAYYTNSSYAARHVRLNQSIETWFGQHAAHLGGRNSPLFASLRDHYRVIAVGHGEHEVILGRDSRLLEALNALPPAATGGASSAGSTSVGGTSGSTSAGSTLGGTVQPKVEPSGLIDDDGLPLVAQALDSPGRPLDDTARRFLGSRFRQDFSQVRIHTDPAAAESARAMNAQAYTVGRDIVFGRGYYDSASARGQRLLAHELAHVVQQTGVAPASAGTVQRQATSTPETAQPIRADEGGKALSTFRFGPFSIFVPRRVSLGSRKDVVDLKVHIFFAAGGVQGADTNDVFVHGLRGASDQSDWITIGVRGILNGANKISDSEISQCLRSIGINTTPVAIRLTGHSRGCDSVVNTVSQKLISTPIDRIVLLDEAVEHVSMDSKLADGTPDPKRGSVRLNRVQTLVQAGINANVITAYESAHKSANLLTGASAKVAGAHYHDLNPECMAAIGAARLVEDAIALRPDIARDAAAIPKIATQLSALHLPPRGSFTTGPSAAGKVNFDDFCFDPPVPGAPAGARRIKQSIKTIRSDPTLVRFINQHDLARYSTVQDWTPFLAHEFFVAEIAHELTE